MPTKQLKDLAKEAGKSIEEAEACWEKAKTQANKVYPKGEKDKNYWGFVVNKTKICLANKPKKHSLENW